MTKHRSTAMGMMLASISLAAAQTGERGIVPEDVVQARPAASAAAPVKAKPRYEPLDPQMVASLRRRAAASEIGVTIWRLRPAAAADTGARILIQEASETAEWTPVRVSSSTRLHAGDRVRLTLESPARGYLYVIDRERYASGERGKPYLIFPTARTRNGDNQVMGGKLIDIPAQSDQPNFFTLHRSRPDQAEEELTVLLTPQPLDGIAIGPNALALPEDRVSAWEKQWGASQPEVFELSGGAGRAWTQAEQNAAADGTRLLTQDDPPPQTVYRVAVRPGAALAVQVRLRYNPH
ncbi:MAG: hypothetical protein ABSE42_01535 [Bryobacteraceae bacterium]